MGNTWTDPKKHAAQYDPEQAKIRLLEDAKKTTKLAAIIKKVRQ